MIVAPSLASASAIARPTPEDDPVTIATRPSRLKIAVDKHWERDDLDERLSASLTSRCATY